MFKRFVLLPAFLACAMPLWAQDGFFSRWAARATATQSRQPTWTPPVATTYVGLIQVARIDFTRQLAVHATTWNYDSSKGLNLIPFARTEVDINLPPYLLHSAPTAKNGAGDMSFLFKYRALAGSAEHGSYVLSAFLPFSIATGSYKNGSPHPTLAPSIGVGKGFGAFDVQSTLGATLPASQGKELGRPIVWNTTFQYHIFRTCWPELESNSTFFKGGPNDGKTQEFLTPGIVFGKYRYPYRRHSDATRFGFGFGIAEQIATTHFNTYKHGLIFTSRFLF